MLLFALVPLGCGRLGFSAIEVLTAPDAGEVVELPDASVPDGSVPMMEDAGPDGGDAGPEDAGSCAPLIETSSPLPTAALAEPYDTTLYAIGGFEGYVWTLVSGTLPPGLSLSLDGQISGTPTAAPVPDPAHFEVQVVTGRCTALAWFDLYVVATSQLSCTLGSDGMFPLSIVTTSLPGSQANAPYQVALTASGGVQPYQFSLVGGALPQGLLLDASGIINGTPQSRGQNSYATSFVVEVTDARGCAALSGSLEIWVSD